MFVTTTRRRCPLCHDWMPRAANFCGTCGQALPKMPALPPAKPPLLREWRCLLVGLGLGLPLAWAGFNGWDWVKMHPYAFQRAAPQPGPERTAQGYLVIGPATSMGRKIQCPGCDGSGLVDYVRYTALTPSHEVHAPVPCFRCRGRGWVYEAELYPQFR